MLCYSFQVLNVHPVLERGVYLNVHLNHGRYLLHTGVGYGLFPVPVGVIGL